MIQKQERVNSPDKIRINILTDENKNMFISMRSHQWQKKITKKIMDRLLFVVILFVVPNVYSFGLQRP